MQSALGEMLSSPCKQNRVLTVRGCHSYCNKLQYLSAGMPAPSTNLVLLGIASKHTQHNKQPACATAAQEPLSHCCGGVERHHFRWCWPPSRQVQPGGCPSQKIGRPLAARRKPHALQPRPGRCDRADWLQQLAHCMHWHMPLKLCATCQPQRIAVVQPGSKIKSVSGQASQPACSRGPNKAVGGARRCANQLLHAR